MSATEQVLLVCLPRDGGRVLTADAALDLDSGVVAIAPHALPPAAMEPSMERFIRLKGHPARLPVDFLAAAVPPRHQLAATQLAAVRAALAHRGLHPCAYTNRESLK